MESSSPQIKGIMLPSYGPSPEQGAPETTRDYIKYNGHIIYTNTIE
jgi:hypothetical protein